MSIRKAVFCLKSDLRLTNILKHRSSVFKRSDLMSMSAAVLRL